MQCTHERISLVYVDVPDATTQMHLVIKVDRLHEYTVHPCACCVGTHAHRLSTQASET